jgi:hypothetical protein
MENTKNKLIAYMDILGFSSYVCSNSIEDCFKVLSKFNEIVRGAHSNGLFLFLNRLKDHKDRKTIDHNSIRGQYKYLLLSDSAVITLPCDDEDINEFKVRFVMFLNQLFVLQRYMFDLNLPLRGGITIGEFDTDHTGRLILGKGLVRAVWLEKHAKYPRIIIDRNIVEKFSNSGIFRFETTLDNDGWYFMDNFKKSKYSDYLFNKSDSDLDDIRDILKSVFDLSEIRKYLELNSGNERIRDKVDWVRAQYEKKENFA